ncbi:LON peptidase substrate-binding domain-containing protein [Microbacterium aoyamense]|nr:LON peptidase substrate-binding domain-containing protein [Microbacterium aoyamense]
MDASPMFPLGSVLFPHTPLPLRIFEPRYLVMLGELLDDPDPEFGVVLIQRGHEAGGGDQRLDLGTMARVIRVVAGEEDIQLVAIGRRRVAVTQWLEDDPYPRAVLEVLPDLVWNEEYAPLLEQAESIVRRVLARAGEYAETRWDPDTEVSDEPVEAAWQLAAIAPLTEWDQYRLLRARSVGELLATLIDLTLAAEPELTAPPPGDDFDRELEDLLREADGPEPGDPESERD